MVALDLGHHYPNQGRRSGEGGVTTRWLRRAMVALDLGHHYPNQGRRKHLAVVAGIGGHHRSQSSFLRREKARPLDMVAPNPPTTAQTRSPTTSTVADDLALGGGGRD
ncbi:hypothetical protein CDL15_Pgr005114 [Punica granatum]|nr:hypothetical protein CDL15_Pgr005114 [Punica granatum]